MYIAIDTSLLYSNNILLLYLFHSNFHPPMMLLGMLVLPIQAALIYRTSPITNHQTNKYIHATLHSISLLVILFGVIAVYKSHIDQNIPNFYSLHSWCGITTILLFISNYCIGLISFLYPGIQQHLRVWLVPYHALSGILIIGSGTITILLGLQEKLSFQIIFNKIDTTGTESTLINTVGILVLFTLITIMYSMMNVSGHDKLRGSDSDEHESLLSTRSSYA